ncbi:MAG: hypothetical protein KatS3mg060_1851 [Dehalococcoidia bacterium]|nr:MAG: hypothetical protein KatS3mg060_1851 [Dehalococcoidia bacterium]
MMSGSPSSPKATSYEYSRDYQQMLPYYFESKRPSS